MNTRPALLLLISSALFAAPAVHARGMHKSKPLAFEELPAACQAHFTRAHACYQKTGKAAAFHTGNTDFLRQSLPAATPEQRERMCQMAEEAFAAKAKQLNCE